MKHSSKIPFLSVVCVVMSVLAVCSCDRDELSGQGQFRSIIRLWEAHHSDDSLNASLMSALDRYPDCCDEVWFLFSPDIPMLQVDESLEKLTAAADRMRERGIVVSLQNITLGHPSGLVVDDVGQNRLGFRPMTSHEGKMARTQTCPRDTAFQNSHAAVYARYAEALQPFAIYLDDDLRLTSHAPVPFACFCDSCLKEFSGLTGHQWTREELVTALNENRDGIRKAWISFGQQSLAEYARVVSRAVHKVSPMTRMGLQHANFHHALMEGWDWNPIFRAMKEETGLDPVSRPGHGFYDDHKPRGMLEKACGISRQINRLQEGIDFIAPEIEGYDHRAYRKSPQCVCTETMLYLAMGATSMSYALVCTGYEPMEWYADTYFKYLQRYNSLFDGYVPFNSGSHPCGIGSYLSPNQVYRDLPDFSWAYSEAGSEIFGQMCLGIPFTPESPYCTAVNLDAETVSGMTEAEADSLFKAVSVVMDRKAWAALESRGWTCSLKKVEIPAGTGIVAAMESSSGRRVAVIPSFSSDLTGADRNAVVRAYDWASSDAMYVIVESVVQGVAVPRAMEDGSLRSVTYLNCTISDQEDVVLRLRGCPQKCSCVWNAAGERGRRLKVTRDGEDILVTIPFIKAWDAGWIAVESCGKGKCSGKS